MKQPSLRRRKERVWEIDAMRGLLIFLLLCGHFYFCVDAFCVDGYYHIDSYKFVDTFDPLHFWFDWEEDGVIHRNFLTPLLIELWMKSGVDTFFAMAGISSLFSRNNLKRALRILAAGAFIAAFTYGLWKWTGDPTRFIRFGALYCYGFCELIYVYFFEDKDSKTLLLSSIPVFLIGYYLRYHYTESGSILLYPFGVYQRGAVGSDYWPIFPMLGWYLFGVVLGRKYYAEGKTLYSGRIGQRLDRLTRPLQWFGRHSGALYVGHIVVYTVAFCGIGYLFKLL